MKLAQLNLPGSFTLEDRLQQGSQASRFQNLGTLATAILPYVLVFGGLAFFVMLLISGFEFLTAAGNQDKMAAAANKIKNAFIGFLLLFGVYWLAQIFQVLFKIQIL